MTFPAAEIAVEFVDPSSSEGSMFPTGNLIDDLDVPDIGTFNATMISAGIPTIFIDASELGLKGTELQEDINGSDDWLKKFETIRAHGALKMG